MNELTEPNDRRPRHDRPQGFQVADTTFDSSLYIVHSLAGRLYDLVLTFPTSDEKDVNWQLVRRMASLQMEICGSIWEAENILGKLNGVDDDALDD